jgi:hypothetical protein
MKTGEFLNKLKENGQKELLFEYKEGKFIGANYHITEVKNTVIKSVDCGSRSDAWNETIVQLWESPKEIGKRDYMKVDKAYSILEKVDKIYEMDKEAEVLFEYSNDNFHKANLEVHDVELTSEKIIFKLFVSQTDCKAKDECGVDMKEVVVKETACCEDTGCC